MASLCPRKSAIFIMEHIIKGSCTINATGNRNRNRKNISSLFFFPKLFNSCSYSCVAWHCASAFILELLKEYSIERIERKCSVWNCLHRLAFEHLASYLLSACPRSPRLVIILARTRQIRKKTATDPGTVDPTPRGRRSRRAQWGALAWNRYVRKRGL